MRIIPLLLLITALAEAVADQPERSYKVPVFGEAGQVEVVAKAYPWKHGLSAREQLGVLGADSEEQRNQILALNAKQLSAKSTPIPGIAKGKSEAGSRIITGSNRTGAPHMGQKLRLSYKGELLGEIPGYPLYGRPLSGFDHGHRGPTVSKAIVISDRQLLLVVDQKGAGGRNLDKVYSAMKGEDGNWSITELGIGALGKTDPDVKSNPANKAQK